MTQTLQTFLKNYLLRKSISILLLSVNNMKICIIFGHHNTKDSFNASVRDTFIEEAKKIGHEIDLINLFDEEEQLPFYRSDINPPPQLVMDYRKRLEHADAMF